MEEKKNKMYDPSWVDGLAKTDISEDDFADKIEDL